MKTKNREVASIALPLLTDLIERGKVQAQQTLDKINQAGAKPLAQPNLYQDSGGAYSSKFVFPQD